MVRECILKWALFIELVLVLASTKVGRRKLSTGRRAYFWAWAVWVVFGMIELQSRFEHLEQWSNIPIFYGMEPSMIATVACALLTAGIIERAFLYIGILQHGEMTLLGTAFALPMLAWGKSASLPTSILTFLALSSAIFVSIRHVIVSSPARLPAPGTKETSPPDDIGPNGSFLAFIEGDRVLMALIAIYISIFLVFVVAPLLPPHLKDLQAILR
ncbi:MAG: hypothetical protein Q4A07_00435 [Coriobacteriales bacterium]|nr:hypothetical protein [Coriobacteriales bacterium]